MTSAKRIRVSQVGISSYGKTSRVSAMVDGEPLWFESDDTVLTPALEAFGSSLLLTSQHRARALDMDGEASSVWVRNVDRIIEQWSAWWGYVPQQPVVATRHDDDVPSPGEMLLFSGGVDSFYSLFSRPAPQILVSVHGFDIVLADSRRMSLVSRALHEVASARGCKPVIVRTNLRTHRAIGKPYLWERGHGGALAAIGHLLSAEAGHLKVSSSISKARERAWGSHSEIDPLFGSGRTTVEVVGNEAQREMKIAAIADNKLAQEHLRVCWENRSENGNCSRCEKCLITMLQLAEIDKLSYFRVFESGDLERKVKAIRVSRQHVNLYDRVAKRGKLDEPVIAAIEALVRRSRRAAPLFEYRSRMRSLVDRYG